MHVETDRSATEALRVLLNAVLVETGEGDIIPRAAYGSVRPDRSLNATDADFSKGYGVSYDGFPPES